jgi:glycosyltransferase involved in cell wall biosynthesis
MRVCIVTTAFPRWPGDDRGIFILEAARAIQAQGVCVKVVSMHSPGAKAHEVLESVEVYRPRYLWPDRFEVLQKEGGGLPIAWRRSRLARLAFLPLFIAQAVAAARHTGDCDLIHAQWTWGAGVALAARLTRRVPIVATVQGSDIFEAAKLPLMKPLTRAVLSRCDRVIALSRSLAESTIALGIPMDKVTIVPNGVDTKRYHPSANARESLILFVGSLIGRKGIHSLIRAMPRVLHDLPGYHLTIVGEGPLLPELRQLAASLQLGHHVRFVGAQPPDMVCQWMQRARLFVLPSLEEGLGVVLLEAIASGTPCVGTRVGGIPDVISPEVGRLVPPNDPSALADAIVSQLRDQDTWCQMSRAARTRATDFFDWEKIARRLVAIYRDAIAGHGRESEGDY